MKLRHSLVPGLLAGALLFGGAASAQDNMAPAAAPATAASAQDSMAPATAPATADSTSATLQTPQGQVVIKSTPAPAPTIAPAPDFKSLSGGSKYITAEQAASYAPLANDFLHADTNRDGKVSRAEYERWVKQMK